MLSRQTPPSASRLVVPGLAGRAAAHLVLGLFGTLLYAQAVLESAQLFTAFGSAPTWQAFVARLGARPVAGDPSAVAVSLGAVSAVVVPLLAFFLAIGAGLLRRGTQVGGVDAALLWADRGGRWWLLPGIWWVLSTLALLVGVGPLSTLLDQTCEVWLAVSLAGSVSAWFTVRRELRTGAATTSGLADNQHERRRLYMAVAVSGLLFTALNWGLWFNLRVPHGDSAMYEEHLWNVEHGKGFRSYLDQGLFLGEHVQVVHLLLLPLHWLWPSQMLLELCQAFAMAAGAIPVYRLAQRFGGSPRAALLLACAYLLYFPLQYLDLTIDLKTFRPNSLGVPALLFALDALERGRHRACLAWLALMLSAQEDYAIVISLLGAWIALTAGQQQSQTATASNWSLRAMLQRILSPAARPRLLFGLGLALFGVVYLVFVMKVVFPYFRNGVTIHYASYFSKFGKTPEEIVRTILTRPDLVLAELITVPAILYAVGLLAPLGGLPLRVPARLLVAAPLFALLCLNDLALQPPAPVHHFHAPLVPLLFWAAAAALGPQASTSAAADTVVRRARFACLCALATGLFMSITPLGFKFWDANGSRNWHKLYVPDERARQFPVVDALIPADARVASTDFVHARLTHRERSYDYSDYVRKVADYEDRVPLDTDWIVIDIEHPYNSAEKSAALRSNPYTALREVREQPEQWQLVDHPASQYFIVLKRR
ncbi:MAG: DUF2079 domain-containing protein [Planctomycetaceae bacterium]